MPVSIHLPPPLLERVDARARRLGLTRSSYISQTLERDLSAEGGWSPGFFDALRQRPEALHEAMRELKAGLRRKSRKRSPFR